MRWRFASSSTFGYKKPDEIGWYRLTYKDALDYGLCESEYHSVRRGVIFYKKSDEEWILEKTDHGYIVFEDTSSSNFQKIVRELFDDKILLYYMRDKRNPMSDKLNKLLLRLKLQEV